MARNLIVCCDGTWNDPKNRDDGVPAPTNVFKLFNAVDLNNAATVQLTRYQSGVGTEGLLDRFTGGALGVGLNDDIRDCYEWLARKYQPGDRIYLFGFSRGAFTARSLGGMICRLGILDVDTSVDVESDVKQMYRRGYRNRQDVTDEFVIHANSRAIEFIGVWDTVGALGIPDDKAVLNLFDAPEKHRFHDTQLSDKVEIARHAVAIDEMRGSFMPTLWQEDTGHPNLQQIWFAGVHSDVGGGYKEMGLSDCTLKWMLDEAHEAGVRFVATMTAQVQPDPADELHDSHTGLMKVLVSAPRSIPPLDGPDIHATARKRRAAPPLAQLVYRPTRRFVDGEIELDIYAKHPWNWTGVFLKAGRTYRFSAAGQWHDASISCGPSGTSDGDFHVGELVHVAGSLWGMGERAFGALTGNESVNFVGTKRHEHADWFALMGVIADSGNPGVDGSLAPLTNFEIGAQCTFTPARDGYLYCYANDAWGFYDNNRGFVTLTIEEL